MTHATRLNLGCGTDKHPDAKNIDASPDCNPDQVYDITDYPWPWADVAEIRMFHVLEHLPDMARALREAARVLQPGGKCLVKLPMGQDATADPDHTWGQNGHPWTWRTPEFYCGKRHWDDDVGLTVKRREVDLWAVHASPLQRGLHQTVWKWARRHYGPGEWCFDLPQSCGEFTIEFRNP